MFYEQPQPVIVPVGGTKLLSVYAPGATSHQWYRDGEPLEGETGTVLEVDWMKLPKPRADQRRDCGGVRTEMCDIMSP